MRVLIYGGRDLVATDEHYMFLNRSVPQGDITVVSGGAKGADAYGAYWANLNDYTVDEFPADWDKYGKGAGHIRNQQMLDSGIDLAVQFPGGRGTADMRRRLDAAGVKVIEYKEQDE